MLKTAIHNQRLAVFNIIFEQLSTCRARLSLL